MGKKKKKSRKDLLRYARSYQNQYNKHEEKIMNDPKSDSVSHWKKEKENFLSRINYYLLKAKVDSL
ncbi:MAG: hypothetical protein EU531_07700 [Promethearchaeota archaeon]|nr:MAG: hypothetical protein EU531_07700 [Candidatus Lokiarchaeota archaeon]